MKPDQTEKFHCEDCSLVKKPKPNPGHLLHGSGDGIPHGAPAGKNTSNTWPDKIYELCIASDN